MHARAVRLAPALAALAAVPALGVLATLAGCSAYQPFDSAAYLRGEYSRLLGPAAAAGVEVPFSLSPRLAESFHRQVRPVASPRGRVTQIIDFVFDRLDLKYALAPTRSAAETFEARQGNCLSFVNLFVGLARDLGLAPFYVEVTDYQRWSHRQGMVVSQGHIVAGLYLDGELSTYDFLPYRNKSYRNFKPIDDLTAAAHYFNNLGAEALLGGDPKAALELSGIASRIAPGFVKARNNLGVIQARGGNLEGALATYGKALEIEPGNPTVLVNQARVLQELGRGPQAEAVLAQVEASNTDNPFFFVYLGEMALAQGEPQKALDAMAKALRLNTELPEVHVGLVKVYMALGDLDKARHHLERALKLDATQEEALRYARLLER
jgi:Flp pilus assembly protein TadD